MFADRREEYLRENKTAKARGNADMIKGTQVKFGYLPFMEASCATSFTPTTTAS